MNIIDWSKVKVDTKVLVSDDKLDWFPRYFAEYKKGKVYCFNRGATSFSIDDKRNIVIWEYAKLYQE